MSNHEFDIAIIGGGLAGLSAANYLQHLGFKIALINASPFTTTIPAASSLARAIALSLTTKMALQQLDLWQQVQQHSTPIKDIHVSEKGRFGATRFSAAESNLEALGFVIKADMLSYILYNGFKLSANVIPFANTELTDLELGKTSWKLDLKTQSGNSNIYCKLLLAADSDKSLVRKHLGIKSETFDYNQQAIVANCEVDGNTSHKFTAFERFCGDSFIAMLPQQGMHTLVWAAAKPLATSLMSLHDADFLQQLQQHFGFKLGKFKKISKRITFPLKLLQAQTSIGPNMVLLGNALHNLHPIAAQGFNLTLRDVKILTTILAENITGDFASSAVLQQYQQQRQRDQKATVTFTHGLYKIFNSNNKAIQLGRPLAMVMADIIPPAKSFIKNLGSGQFQRF